MRSARWAAAVAAALGLAAHGCSAPARLARPACDADTVLAQAERLQGRVAGDLAAEYRAAEKAFADSGGACDRFRLALVLLGPDLRHRDEGRAIALLTDYLTDAPPSEGGLRSLAKLLIADARRERDLDTRLHDVSRRAAEEKTRADGLKRQLDELREIERILNERQKR